MNLSEGDVYINGKKHEINSHGIVKVDNIKNDKLNISSDGKNENRATVVSNNGEKTATFDINANQIIDNMDKGTHTVTQEAGYGKNIKKENGYIVIGLMVHKAIMYIMPKVIQRLW